MTTLEIVPKKNRPEPSAEELAAKELVRMAREQGLSLTGPDGLLKQFTKSVLETALNEEMTEHLGHEKHRAPEERDSTNIRNGTRPKTVLTEATGHVEIDVPRDRDGSFEPQIVRKRQRRLTGVDEIVLSLYAKGLTSGEICAHFAEIYDASVSKETISRITDKVIEEMNDWANRPLDGVYAAIFIDAIVVEGPRRPGREPSDLCRDRGLVGWGKGRSRVVGRHRRGGGEVLAGGADRSEEPGREGCVLPGLRRSEGSAGCGGERVAVDHGADLHHPLCRRRHKLHKIRNVQDHLPQKLRGLVGQRMRQAYHADSALAGPSAAGGAGRRARQDPSRRCYQSPGRAWPRP